MRIRPGAIIAGIAAAFMACSAGAADSQGSLQTVFQRSTLGTSVRNGTITSMTATRMIIVRTHKGKTEQLKLILNSETVWKGELAIGSSVTVHYRTENNLNIATSIQARKSFESSP